MSIYLSLINNYFNGFVSLEPFLNYALIINTIVSGMSISEEVTAWYIWYIVFNIQFIINFYLILYLHI